MKYYFFRLLEKLKIIKYFNFTASTTINHQHIRIPVINGLGHQHFNNHESWFKTFLQKLLPLCNPGVMDVGVNIGQTLLKVLSIDKNIPYVGFEPNPFVFCYAYRLIEENNLTNHKIFYTGLSNDEDVLTLHMDNYMSSGASVLPAFRTNMEKFKKKLQVPVFKGDKILAKYPTQAGFLKIDVEGAELEVLQGLQNFLTEQQPIIVLEILPVYSLENTNGSYRKKREEALISFLHTLHYSMYRIGEKDLSITPLNEIEIHGDMDLTNYLFVPNVQKATIEAAFN